MTDFGLGVRATGLSNELSGTPMYMAPELFAGSPASEAADIYSLGLTLWFVLAGRHPFATDTLRSLTAEVLRGPESLRRVRSDVPAELVKIVEKSVALDAAARPASASEFVRALEACAASLGRSPNRRRAHAMRFALVGGAIALAAITVAVTLPKLRDDRRSAVDRVPRASAAIILGALFLASLTPIGRAEGRSPRALLDEVWALRSEERYAAMESLATAVRLGIEDSAHPDTMVIAETWLAAAESRLLRSLFADSLGLQAASRSLALFEASGAPDSVLAEVHRTLGVTFSHRREFGLAVVHEEAMLALRRRAFGNDDPMVAHALYNLGGSYRRVGELDSALVAYREALDIWQRLHVPRNHWIGDLYSEIGIVRELQGEDELAEQAYQSAIRSHEEELGSDDPALAFSLNRAAGFAYRRGDVAGVIDDTERSVKILSRHAAEDNEGLLLAKLNLAQSYQQLGDNARALALFDEACPGVERLRGANSEVALASRVAHANVCAALGDTAMALALLEEAWPAFAGDSARAESGAFASALVSEAVLRHGRGEDDLALRLAGDAVAVRRIGILDPASAIAALTLQMTILSERGDWNGVDRLDQEVDRALADLPARTSEAYVQALVCRSEVAEQRGRTAEALELALDAARLGREGFVQNIRALSDRQALVLSAAGSAPLDELLALGSGSDARAVALTWDELIRCRGLVRAEVSRRRLTSLASGDSAYAAAHAFWIHAERRLAQLEVHAASETRDRSTDSTLTMLRGEADEAERRLVHDFPDARLPGDPSAVGLDSVLAALAPDQTLVGFAQAAAAGGARHLLAFAARGDRSQPRSIDLGLVSELQAMVAAWEDRLAETDPSRRSEGECRRAGARVRERVWDPIFHSSDGAREFFLVVEQPLVGVPWGALPDGTRDYLVESNVRIHVLDAERDLLARPDDAMGSGLLAIGGVEYDRARSGDLIEDATAAAGLRAPLSECDGAALAALPPLPGTEEEVRDIQALWDLSSDTLGAPILLEGSEATESEFKRLALNRRVLHLATHGVVLGDSCEATGPGTRGVGGLGPLPSDAARAVGPASRPGPNGARTAAPASAAPSRRLRVPQAGLGRRVLLALADANHAREHADDENEGLLTAEEVSTLDLRGVDWVVLSACRTAAGDAWAHEGVLGMQRAFRLAGARTVIASEWSVEDSSTREWMTALYRARLRGTLRGSDTIAEAERAVLAARRRDGRSTHPFFWAAFTATGE